jgi:hypothetical protein
MPNQATNSLFLLLTFFLTLSLHKITSFHISKLLVAFLTTLSATMTTTNITENNEKYNRLSSPPATATRQQMLFDNDYGNCTTITKKKSTGVLKKLKKATGRAVINLCKTKNRSGTTDSSSTPPSVVLALLNSKGDKEEEEKRSPAKHGLTGACQQYKWGNQEFGKHAVDKIEKMGKQHGSNASLWFRNFATLAFGLCFLALFSMVGVIIGAIFGEKGCGWICLSLGVACLFVCVYWVFNPEQNIFFPPSAKECKRRLEQKSQQKEQKARRQAEQQAELNAKLKSMAASLASTTRDCSAFVLSLIADVVVSVANMARECITWDLCY